MKMKKTTKIKNLEKSIEEFKQIESELIPFPKTPGVIVTDHNKTWKSGSVSLLQLQL